VTQGIRKAISVVASSPKVSSQRTKHPEETLRAIAPLFGHIGLTRIADVTGLDCIGIPVVMAVRPNSRSLSVSQGKGIDLFSAKVSGGMEALELYCAERRDWSIRLQRWSELAESEKAIDPHRLPSRKGRKFSDDTAIGWVEALDIVSGNDYLVPLDLVHTDFTLPLSQGSEYFPLSSSGLASGNTYSEAILHALCELIERDAFTISLESNTPRVRIDLNSITDPELGQLIRRIDAAQCTITIDDLTSIRGVPTFWAVLRGSGKLSVTDSPAGGLASHPNPTWACVRAITEAAQSRLTRLSGSRDDLTAAEFRMPASASGESNVTSLSAFPINAGLRAEFVEQDLRWIIDKLAQQSLTQILVVDLTRSEFEIPVVRVLVPGLRYPHALHAVSSDVSEQ
jgi:YcaO-like protein with predicted kinase domain